MMMDPTSDPAPASAGRFIQGSRSGFHTIAPEIRGGFAPLGHVPSAWALVATASWLLVLTVVSVTAARFGLGAVFGVTALQGALIALVLMRTAWDRRVYLLVFGFGALVVALLSAAAFADRQESRPDVDRFASPVDLEHAGPSD